MKKHLLALAVLALAAGGAIAQANDTIAKAKASGVFTQGVRDSCHGPIISDTSIGAISLRGQDEHERQKTTQSV